METVTLVLIVGVALAVTVVPEFVNPAALVAFTVKVYEVGETPDEVTVEANEPVQVAVVPTTVAPNPDTEGLTVTV